MGKMKDDEAQKDKQRRIKSVIELLIKQSPLTLQQKRYCYEDCVMRFLKAKGDNVKKAAKQLRNCLSWRHSFGIDHLIADEFCGELGEGVAYVAGHDDELRPVMIFRIKQDYQKLQSHKLFIRLLVFTLEVAIQTMPKNVHQFVLLFDASFFKSASAFMNMLMATLKIIADYYPLRLYKAFLIDPPSLFTYIWKGVRPFVELSPLTILVSSVDFEEPIKFNNFMTSSYPRATSRRFDPSSTPSTTKLGTCSSSSRFSFTVSHHFDSLKPWYLSLTDTSKFKIDRTNISDNCLGTSMSPLNARSLSFSSLMSRKNYSSSTPLSRKIQNPHPFMFRHSRTLNPSFLRSPALFFRRDFQPSRAEKSRELFLPFLKFYRRPYDEMVYRSKINPPLGGLISIVSPQIKQRRSISQRFDQARVHI